MSEVANKLTPYLEKFVENIASHSKNEVDIDKIRLELLGFCVEYGDFKVLDNLLATHGFFKDFFDFFGSSPELYKWGLFFFYDYIPILYHIFPDIKQESLSNLVITTFDFAYTQLKRENYVKLYFNSVFDILKDNYRYYLLNKIKNFYKENHNIDLSFDFSLFSSNELMNNKLACDFQMAFFDVIFEKTTLLINKWKFLFFVHHDLDKFFTPIFQNYLILDKKDKFLENLMIILSFFPDIKNIRDFIYINKTTKHEINSLLSLFNNTAEYRKFYDFILLKKLDVDEEFINTFKSSEFYKEMEKSYLSGSKLNFVISKLGINKEKVEDELNFYKRDYFIKWKNRIIPQILNYFLNLIYFEDLDKIIDLFTNKLIDFSKYNVLHKDTEEIFYNMVTNLIETFSEKCENSENSQESFKLFLNEFKEIRINTKNKLAKVLFDLNTKIILSDKEHVDYKEITKTIKKRLEKCNDRLEFLLEYTFPYLIFECLVNSDELSDWIKNSIKEKINNSWIFNPEVEKYEWFKEFKYLEDILLTAPKIVDNNNETQLLQGQLTKEYVEKIEKEMPKEHPENLYAMEKLMDWTMDYEKHILLDILSRFPDIKFLMTKSNELVDLLDALYKAPELEEILSLYPKELDENELINTLKKI